MSMETKTELPFGRRRVDNMVPGLPWIGAGWGWDENVLAAIHSLRRRRNFLSDDCMIQEGERRWKREARENSVPAKVIKEAQRAEIAAIKARSGCKNCGEKDPDCLDFHHRDPKEKLFNIALSGNRDWPDIFAEIKKCDVLCTNCHRKHHAHLRRGLSA